MKTTIIKAEPQSVSSETVLTVVDAARFLRISESVVRRLIRERRIPFFRIDGRYLLYRPALEEWIRNLIEPPTGKSAVEQAQEGSNRIWANNKEGVL